MSLARYTITWRPVWVRVVVAAAAATVFIVYTPAYGFVGRPARIAHSVEIGVLLGTLLPSLRVRVVRDCPRRTSLEWGMLALAVLSTLGVVCWGSARDFTFADRQLGAELLIGANALATALFMPVRRARPIARRADGVAAACTKCGEDCGV